MDIERHPFDLRDCLESALDLVSTRAAEKRLDIAYVYDDSVPAAISADFTRLRQILLSLLSNAVEFTEAGEVVLQDSATPLQSGQIELAFAVHDTGTGLSADGMTWLFQSFSQADSSTTRKYGGTGLGLAISKRMSELMDGTMTAESAGLGKGSTFRFTIRAEMADLPLTRSRDLLGGQAELAGKRLLIVDDNATDRRIPALQTGKWGMLDHNAASPKEALDWLQEKAMFDLAIVDMHMPDLDGASLAREIRALRPALPLILFSSLGLRDLPVIETSSVEGINNIVRCIGLGGEDYLLKPVNPVLLKARLTSGLEKKWLRDEQKVLLRRFATSEVVQDLQESGFALGGRRVHASILFCDIRGFTAISERQPPEETIDLLKQYYTLMFEAIDSHGGIVTLMIGDGLMVLFGAPRPLDNPAALAVAAAQDMLAMMDQFNMERKIARKPEIKLGIGIATGEVVAGYAGTQQRATCTCIGDKVNLASRLEAHTKTVSSCILMDEDTKCALTLSRNVECIGKVLFNGFSNPVTVFSI